MKERGRGVSDLLHHEYQRFASKSPFWSAVSIVGLYLILQVITWFGQIFWPLVIDFRDRNEIPEWKFSIYFYYMFNIPVLTITNLVFMAIYRMEHPFFEQYKV